MASDFLRRGGGLTAPQRVPGASWALHFEPSQETAGVAHVQGWRTIRCAKVLSGTLRALQREIRAALGQRQWR
jgi:hypothetical protein